MAETLTIPTSIKIWFDPEADFLEVIFVEAIGYMRETEHDAVMERVDMEGNFLGFHILGVSKMPNHPFLAYLRH